MSLITSEVSGSTVLGIDGGIPKPEVNPDYIYFPDWNAVIEKGGLINILAASSIFGFKPNNPMWAMVEPFMDLTRPYLTEPPVEQKEKVDLKLPKIKKV